MDTAQAIDKRPKAAVYSWYRNKRDKRAVELLYMFCAVTGLRPTMYLDKRTPKEGQPALWRQLCRDVEAGQYQVVMTWLDIPGMQEWCAERGVRYEQVDPFEFFSAMREACSMR